MYYKCVIFLQVILGILLLFPCLWMEFRSKEELQLMPQTMEEHIQEVGSDSDTGSVTSDNSHRTHQVAYCSCHRTGVFGQGVKSLFCFIVKLMRCFIKINLF